MVARERFGFDAVLFHFAGDGGHHLVGNRGVLLGLAGIETLDEMRDAFICERSFRGVVHLFVVIQASSSVFEIDLGLAARRANHGGVHGTVREGRAASTHVFGRVLAHHRDSPHGVAIALDHGKVLVVDVPRIGRGDGEERIDRGVGCGRRRRDRLGLVVLANKRDRVQEVFDRLGIGVAALSSGAEARRFLDHSGFKHELI